MGLKNWIDRINPIKVIKRFRDSNNAKEVLWLPCKNCKSMLYKIKLLENNMLCYYCSFHFRMKAVDRLKWFFDDGRWESLGENIILKNDYKFKDLKSYNNRLQDAKNKTNINEAVLVGKGSFFKKSVIVFAFEFDFIGGSMGSVVGDKLTLAFQKAIDERIPIVGFFASGGARMQESMVSLLQMLKTAGMVSLIREIKCPFISVLTNPVYGGVTASVAMLGDVIISEYDSFVGFAGPRVIEQTVKQKLPDGFQSAKFLLDNGSIDLLVNRHKLKSTVNSILKKLNYYLDNPILKSNVTTKL